MNEFEQCIDEWATRCREKDAQITSLQAALDAERETNQGLVTRLQPYVGETGVSESAVEVLTRKLTELTQLQALVRAVEHELVGIVKRNQGGYIGDRVAIDKCLTIIRTLDAMTPATLEQPSPLKSVHGSATGGILPKGDGE